MSEPDRQGDAAPERPGPVAPPPPSDGGPVSSAPPSSLGLERPLTLALRPFAIFAVVAVILGRAVAPSLVGAAVGMNRLVQSVSFAGALVSQVFAFAAMLLAILSVIAVARSRLPLPARLGAITLGGFAVLPTVWAVHQPVPQLSAALVGGSASLLALLAVPSARRAPFARVPMLVIVLVAVGGLLRILGVALGLRASPGLFPLAGALATASFLADALAIAAAIGWIASRSQRLTSPASFAVLAGALLCTRAALAGHGDSLRAVEIFFWRAAERLTTRPLPAVPLAFQIFVGFLAPLVAAWTLGTRPGVPALSGAVALALCAHSAVEMPPSALMLIVGSLGLSLAALDGRGMWASLSEKKG